MIRVYERTKTQYHLLKEKLARVNSLMGASSVDSPLIATVTANIYRCVYIIWKFYFPLLISHFLSNPTSREESSPKKYGNASALQSSSTPSPPNSRLSLWSIPPYLLWLLCVRSASFFYFFLFFLFKKKGLMEMLVLLIGLGVWYIYIFGKWLSITCCII